MKKDYLTVARAAVADYKQGVAVRGFPPPKTRGLCARAARALWEACHPGQAFPFGQRDANGDGDVDANDMLQLLRHRGCAIEGGAGLNAYQRALAKGALRPGSLVFFSGAEPFGHVATVLAIGADPHKALSSVLCFENTTAPAPRGPGTCISTLAAICGKAGTGRILAVANYLV